MAKAFRWHLDHLVRNRYGTFGRGWVWHPALPLTSAHLLLREGNGTVRRTGLSCHEYRPDVERAHPGARNAGFHFLSDWDAAGTLAIEFRFGTTPPVEVALPASLDGGRGFAARLRETVGLRRARPALPSGRACRLIVDHDLGGGTNLYRERVCASWLAQDRTVLLLCFHAGEMRFRLEQRERGRSRRFEVARPDELIDWLGDAELEEVLLNSVVSFPRPERMLDLAIGLQRLPSKPRLSVAMHDHFPACPSYFLIDASGRFCGIPDPGACAHCLPQVDDRLAQFAGARDISGWRAAWSVLLGCADRILCFSASSRTLLARAYPDLDLSRVDVTPHFVAPLPPLPRAATPRRPFTIGVVGRIAFHKGAGVVRALAGEIRRRGLAARIAVIGTLDAEHDPDIVEVSGEFDAASLPERIRAAGVDVALFPSIGAETFSFVVHELMEMELPLACFDIGAQADAVRAYRLGRIVSSTEAGPLLDALLALHAALPPRRIGEGEGEGGTRTDQVLVFRPPDDPCTRPSCTPC